MAVHRDNPRGGSRDDSENVESVLARSHKATAQAGFHINFMLTKRKLNRDRIEAAISYLSEALERMQQLRRRTYGNDDSSVGQSSRGKVPWKE